MSSVRNQPRVAHVRHECWVHRLFLRLKKKRRAVDLWLDFEYFQNVILKRCELRCNSASKICRSVGVCPKIRPRLCSLI